MKNAAVLIVGASVLAGCAARAPEPAAAEAVVAPAATGPATPVEYEISFPAAAHHEAEVRITFRDLPSAPLQVRMSRSSPGRYALHEFAKNVYSVRATDGAGRRLLLTRPDPHQWNVHGHDGTVVFSYTLFGDRVDGTYAGIDETHAHLNIPATFAWARGLNESPVVVTFRRRHPEQSIATQLAPTADPETFTAADLQYFMDSPTEVSDFELRTWEIGPASRRQTIRLAVHHLGSDEEVDRFATMARAVVAEAIGVWGEAPEFDLGSYTFIADYLPWAWGDGMEHRNSTILTSTRPLATGSLGNLGTLSHEVLHAWNVERLRPADLEPFDFEEANMSGELWFAEGFTSYYTPILIVRAGLMQLDELAASLTRALETVINSPGRRYFSPVEMSRQAPFVDAAVSVDPTNRSNTFISYYTWGSVIGLGLDLELRRRYALSLDDYMAALWDAYGKAERPYDRADLRTTLAGLTGDEEFAAEFFRRHVEGSEVMDYGTLLAQAGLLLRSANPGSAWMGDPALGFAPGAMIVEEPVRAGTPLYEAGLDRGDTIVSIGGSMPASAGELRALLENHRPGDMLDLEFRQRGRARTARVTLREDPALEVVSYERAGLELTDEIRTFREAWLGSKAAPH